MALDIKPTRSELINLKRRIKQTQNGYKLLKMKRDGLFHEFRTLLSEMIEAKQELSGTYQLALQRINLASAVEGGLAVKSAALASSTHPEVTVQRRNIMGVVVPSVEGINLRVDMEKRGIGLIGSSPYIDEAAESYGKLIEKIDSALRKIKEGTYGICEETSAPIGIKRLIARPIATLSIDAQELHERKEKVYRDE